MPTLLLLMVPIGFAAAIDMRDRLAADTAAAMEDVADLADAGRSCAPPESC
jgi:hypothetical protein